MIEFKEITINHKPVIEKFWAIKMDRPFNLHGHMWVGENEFKTGDYLTIDEKGYISGKRAETMESK